MKKLLFILIALSCLQVQARGKYDNTDTLVVARDGTGEFRTIAEAVEVCRAFMEYTKVIYVKNGTYKEKLVIPSWLTNIEIVGQDRDKTVITYDDHANILYPLRASRWAPSALTPSRWRDATLPSATLR